MGKGRARGEANTEYVILLMFVLICAVVGLFTSYSSTIKKIQLEKGLCVDCVQKDKMAKSNPQPSPPPSSSSNKSSATTAISDMAAPTNAANRSWWESFKSFLGWW